MGRGGRYAVLMCAEDSEYVKNRYGGYFGVFVNMLAEEGEEWDVFRVVSGEFPADDEVGDYDGFVITGSCCDAFGDDVWILRLLNLLDKLVSLKTKVLGICFGHQILGRAVGGKIRRSLMGWDIGVRTIHFSPSSSSIKMPKLLPVIECHQDEVWELPPKAEVLALSNRTGVEMFRYGDNIMGIQGHPEYTKDILLHLINRLLLKNLITHAHAEEVKVSVEALEPDREAWRTLCLNFLKGGL